MLRVTLVRHGQARFDEDNYDLLSDRGRRQAAALGQWWRTQSFCPAFAWSGGMVRQNETAQLALQALLGASAARCPDVHVEPRLREFDHREIFYQHRPDLREPAALAHWKAHATDYAQTFAETYDAALQRWMSGVHDTDYAESWLQFKARCVAGLLAVCAAAHDHRSEPEAARPQTPAELLVFTSSGPISALIQSCWEVPDHRVRALQQGLMNSGLTSLRVDAALRWTLETVNACPHLMGGPEEISWR